MARGPVRCFAALDFHRLLAAFAAIATAASTISYSSLANGATTTMTFGQSTTIIDGQPATVRVDVAVPLADFNFQFPGGTVLLFEGGPHRLRHEWLHARFNSDFHRYAASAATRALSTGNMGLRLTCLSLIGTRSRRSSMETQSHSRSSTAASATTISPSMARSSTKADRA
jgi:hypothetical protein